MYYVIIIHNKHYIVEHRVGEFTSNCIKTLRYSLIFAHEKLLHIYVSMNHKDKMNRNRKFEVRFQRYSLLKFKSSANALLR